MHDKFYSHDAVEVFFFIIFIVTHAAEIFPPKNHFKFSTGVKIAMHTQIFHSFNRLEVRNSRLRTFIVFSSIFQPLPKLHILHWHGKLRKNFFLFPFPSRKGVLAQSSSCFSHIASLKNISHTYFFKQILTIERIKNSSTRSSRSCQNETQSQLTSVV